MPRTLAAPPLLDRDAAIADAASCVGLVDAMGADAMAYCRNLARANMSPYPLRRSQQWDEAAWNATALTRRFFFVMRGPQRHGFASTFDDAAAQSIHLGDLQLEPAHTGQGTGTQAIQHIVRDAQRCGRAAITLNVFYDNPALRLYERHGFEPIHFDGNKIRMKKTL